MTFLRPTRPIRPGPGQAWRVRAAIEGVVGVHGLPSLSVMSALLAGRKTSPDVSAVLVLFALAGRRLVLQEQPILRRPGVQQRVDPM